MVLDVYKRQVWGVSYDATHFSMIFIPIYAAVVYRQRGRGWAGLLVSGFAIVPGLWLCIMVPHLAAACVLGLAGLAVDVYKRQTLGCYGQPLRVTPNLDALAANGTRYENAFTCQPVCGPAPVSYTHLSEAALRAGVAVRVHLKVDTGMGRIGFTADDDICLLYTSVLPVL